MFSGWRLVSRLFGSDFSTKFEVAELIAPPPARRPTRTATADFAAGDCVFGVAAGGALQRRVAVSALAVAAMPGRGADFPGAATLPTAFLTAEAVIQSFQRAHPGQRLRIDPPGPGCRAAGTGGPALEETQPSGIKDTHDRLAQRRIKPVKPKHRLSEPP